MHKDVHKAALRAAAKIALTGVSAVTIFACSAGISEELDNSDISPPAADPKADDEASLGQRAEAISLSKLAKHSIKTLKKGRVKKARTKEPVPTGLCAAEVQCLELVRKQWAPPSDYARGLELTPADASKALVSCCEQLIKSDLATNFDFDVDWRRWECCGVTGMQSAITCTPWGPPMPPSMPKGYLT